MLGLELGTPALLQEAGGEALRVSDVCGTGE